MRFNGLKGLSLSIESLDFCDVVGGVVLDDPGFSVGDFVNGTFESIEHEIGPSTFAVTSLGRTAAVVQNALVGAIVVDDPFGTVKDIVFGVGGVVQRKAGSNVFRADFIQFSGTSGDGDGAGAFGWLAVFLVSEDAS